MGVIGDIGALLGQVYKIWLERGPRSPTPRRVYESYIAPSYALLKEVHADYLDLYLELEERIELEEELSAETVHWFARARTRRQADRSELRAAEMPKVGKTRDTNDFDTAVEEYLSSLRAYFLPTFKPFPSSDERILTILGEPTGSSRMAQLLELARFWLLLSSQDQQALLAEEYHERFVTNDYYDLFSNAEMIEAIMVAVAAPPKIRGGDQFKVDDDLRFSLETPYGRKDLSWHQIAADQQRGERWWENADLSIEGRRWHQLIRAPMWRQIIIGHAQRQRRRLEAAMEDIQRLVVRVRIFADQTARR